MKEGFNSMSKLLAATALAAGLFGLASVALAECEIFNAEFDQAVRSDAERRASFDNTTTRDLRRLRDAARLLDSYGKEDACETVAEALREIAEKPKESREARRERMVQEKADRPAVSQAQKPTTTTIEQPATSTTTTGQSAETVQQSTTSTEQTQTTSEPEMSYEEQRKQRLATAKRYDDAGAASVKASDMIGADIYDLDDNDVGEIQNLILSDKGTPAYVVISHGGFLGLGEKQVAVPFGLIRVSGDGSSFYVNMTDEDFDKAPDFDMDEFDWAGDEAWRRENDAYYLEVEKRNAG
jgi:hypothetical protein